VTSGHEQQHQAAEFLDAEGRVVAHLPGKGRHAGRLGAVVVAVVVLANVSSGGMRSITFVQAFQYWLKLTALLVPAAVLLAVWAAIPAVLWFQPSLFGAIEAAVGFGGYLHDVGIAWLALGVAGLVFRVGQLWLEQDWMTGLVWMTKILTDPFHDIWLYHKAPLHLLRGELIDPMVHVRHR